MDKTNLFFNNQLFPTEIPFPHPESFKFTFIDLFAGIGGFQLAMDELGGKCVFASEIDPDAIDTYEQNFGMTPAGDITRIDAKDIPDFDILCGGFPCQSFSIAGKRLGFEDTRGTMFFTFKQVQELHQFQTDLRSKYRGCMAEFNAFYQWGQKGTQIKHLGKQFKKKEKEGKKDE